LYQSQPSDQRKGHSQPTTADNPSVVIINTIMKPNIDTCLLAIVALTEKIDSLAENQAKINTQVNQRRNPSRVYETNGKNSAFWGTGIAEEDIKKGTEISVTLFDAAPSRTGKQAYGFKVRKHTPQEGHTAGAVTSDNEDPSSTPEESRTEKHAPVTTEKGKKVAA